MSFFKIQNLRNLALFCLTSIVLIGGTSRMLLSSPANNISILMKGKAFPDPSIDLPKSQKNQTLVLSGGCFWGMEAVFEHIKGVSKVVAGYAGGNAQTAQYEIVSSGSTGHAESIEIAYDPSIISYGQLLKIYFAIAHDPTELNRQGPDVGSQYRSVIFFSNDQEKKVAMNYIAQLNKAKVFNQPIVTQVIRLNRFYAAEDYHQHFVARNPAYPYVVFNDLPKLQQLKSQFPNLYKN